jgi:hypothetical protein
VGESDPELSKALVALLGRWRIQAQVLADGGQLLLQLLRRPPDLLILGSRLPGLPASALCEIVRRSGALAALPIVRIAGLDEPAGAPEFEAAHVLQPAAVREGLGPILARLGLGQPPAPESAARKEEPKPAGKSADPQVAAAERLARIIVSDIILYNEAKFRAAAAQGDVAAALEHELGEASALFRQRIPEDVRSGRDFLVEELKLRAAKLRAR